MSMSLTISRTAETPWSSVACPVIVPRSRSPDGGWVPVAVSVAFGGASPGTTALRVISAQLDCGVVMSSSSVASTAKV